MEKVWEIKDPDEYLVPRKKRRASVMKDSSLVEKDPAKAYTLSLLFWGVGQNYNDQRGKGLLFQLAMIIFFTGTVVCLFFKDALIQILRSREISAARIFILAEILFLGTLIFWIYNARDAYHTAAKSRTTPFMGISSRVYPFLCSLLIPGWGQFLNGQPIKGSIFSGLTVLGIFSFVTIPSILLAWPSLEASEARFIVEKIFALAMLFAPLIPFIWIFGSYDALKVSVDELKKEAFFDRIKYANNRRRMHGWVQGVIPQIKSTLVLGISLIVLVVFIYHFSPKSYYRNQLMTARVQMKQQGMTIVPELINILLSGTTADGK